MRQKLLVMLLGGAVVVTGCATKNYVRESVTPVQTQVDQLSDQTKQQGTQITQAQQDIGKNTTAISATDEKATSANQRAGEAIAKTDQLDQKTTQQLSQVREEIANLDSYKVVDEDSVLFPLNRATLTKDDKQQLDQLAGKIGNLKHYFIAVEGYTDHTGPPSYNLELSKRRADAVVQYLAVDRNVDFNHIHVIGFGDQKPADPGKTRDARAKNRRVEVKIYSADAAMAAGGS